MVDKKKERDSFFSWWWLLIVVLLIILIINSNKKQNLKDPVFELTGWTKEEFVEWANEVQPIKEHKKWKIWKDGRKELMDTNEPFHAGIINDVNDVPWTDPMYKYEWLVILPRELPSSVIEVLKSITYQDVDKNIGEIFPYAAKPVAICALRDNKPISSEAVKVKLLSLSYNKLSFSVETEPFILSDNPDVRGRIGDKIVLYVPKNCKVGICKPQKRKGD